MPALSGWSKHPPRFESIFKIHINSGLSPHASLGGSLGWQRCNCGFLWALPAPIAASYRGHLPVELLIAEDCLCFQALEID